MPAFFQGVHIVEPKLILDEEGRCKTMALEPFLGVVGSVDGQIPHLVGQGIVLADFVA